MLRELRRFDVKDDQGELIVVSEVASFLTVDGVEVRDGVSTFLTLTGFEVLPNGALGEYDIPRLKKVVREHGNTGTRETRVKRPLS
jgi:hypothetical protein